MNGCKGDELCVPPPLLITVIGFVDYSVNLVVGGCVDEEVDSDTSMVDHLQLHLVNFLVNALHELQNKVYYFFLAVSLQVIRTHQEREVEVGAGWLFTQNFKFVRSQGHEAFQHRHN